MAVVAVCHPKHRLEGELLMVREGESGSLYVVGVLEWGLVMDQMV